MAPKTRSYSARASHMQLEITQDPGGLQFINEFLGGENTLREAILAAQTSSPNHVASVISTLVADATKAIDAKYKNDPAGLVELIRDRLRTWVGDRRTSPAEMAANARNKAIEFVEGLHAVVLNNVSQSKDFGSDRNKLLAASGKGGTPVTMQDKVELGGLRIQLKTTGISSTGEFSRGHSEGKRDQAVSSAAAEAKLAGARASIKGAGLRTALARAGAAVSTLQASGANPMQLGANVQSAQAFADVVKKLQRTNAQVLPPGLRASMVGLQQELTGATRGGAVPDPEQLGQLRAGHAELVSALALQKTEDKANRQRAGVPGAIAALEQEIENQRAFGGNVAQAESYLNAAKAAMAAGEVYTANQRVELGRLHIPKAKQRVQQGRSNANLLARMHYDPGSLLTQITADAHAYDTRLGSAADPQVQQAFQDLAADVQRGGPLAVFEVKARLKDLKTQVGAVDRSVQNARKRDDVRRDVAGEQAKVAQQPPAIQATLQNASALLIAADQEAQTGELAQAERLLTQAKREISSALKAAREAQVAARRQRQVPDAAKVAALGDAIAGETLAYQDQARGGADPLFVAGLNQAAQDLAVGGADVYNQVKFRVGALNRERGYLSRIEKQTEGRDRLGRELDKLQRKIAGMPFSSQQTLIPLLQNAEQAVRHGSEAAAKSGVEVLKHAISLEQMAAKGVAVARKETLQRSDRIEQARNKFARGFELSADLMNQHGQRYGLDPARLAALATQFAGAQTPEGQEDVIRQLDREVSDAKRRAGKSQQLVDNILDAAGTGKAGAVMAKDITNARRRLKVLQRVDPQAAANYEGLIQQMDADAAAFGQAGTDNDRKVAAKQFAANKARADAEIAQYKDQIDEHLAEQSKMNRLGKLLAISKGVSAATGTAAAFLGGPENAGQHMLQGLGQAGGALQTFGTGRLVNKGFGDVGGWAAFGAGAVIGGAAQAMSALYSRGGEVVARGSALGDAQRPIHSGLMSRFGAVEGKDWQAVAARRGVHPEEIYAKSEDIQRARAAGHTQAADFAEFLAGAGTDWWKKRPGAKTNYIARESEKSDISRRLYMIDAAREFSDRVGPTAMFSVLGQSRTGRITSADGTGLFDDQLSPLERGARALGVRYTRRDSGNVSIQDQYLEAARIADYAQTRGRSAEVAGGLAAYHARVNPSRRAGGLRAIYDMTNSQNLGFVGDSRDAALTEILQSLEGSMAGGFRGDFSNDARMISRLARNGDIDPGTGVRFIKQGIDTGARAAGKYTRGFAGMTEFAADVMAFEGTNGDPLEVEKRRQSITERDKLRWVALNAGRDVATMGLTGQGYSVGEAQKLVEGALSKVADNDIKDEEVGWFQETVDRMKAKNPQEFTALVSEKTVSDEEKLAQAANTIDGAAASFHKSVNRFAAGVLNVFG